MRQKTNSTDLSSEEIVKGIRRATRMLMLLGVPGSMALTFAVFYLLIR